MINEKQKQVIDEQKRNILLLASAGTGKTNTLANRISKTLSEKLANPEEILCITFTNKACKEMKERITEIIECGEDIEVKTFHSLCFDIIKSEAKRKTDINSSCIIYDEEDALAIIKENFSIKIKEKDIKLLIDFIKESRLFYGYVTSSIKRDLRKTIKMLKTDSKRLDKFLNNFKKNRNDMLEIILNEGESIVIKYNDILKEYGAMDFIDLIAITRTLFNDESIIERISKKYKYINIDEIQDTSLVEYELIERIFKDSNILLCGDIFQTIYEWRGSNPLIIINKFKEKYSPIEITFDKNYRATKRLTQCATEYLYKAFPDESEDIFKEGITSNSDEIGDKIYFHMSGNKEQEAKWIFNQIMNLPSSERKKACILTRNNYYNQSLSRDLRKIAKGTVNFALIDETKFFRKKEIKDIIAFLKLSINNYDSTSLKRIIRLLYKDITEEDIKKIESKEFKKNGVIINDFIDVNAIKNNDKYGLLEEELKNDNIIVFDVESTGIDTTKDEIIQIAAIRINEKGEELERFMKFLTPKKSVGTSEKVHGFSDAYLIEHGEDKEETLKAFLKFIKNRTIVGHNVQYDINILKSELSRYGLSNMQHKTFFDTLDIYRRFYPGLENHKLNNISNLVNTMHKPNHNALYDILATGEILVYAVENYITPTRKKRINIMKKYSKKFSQVSFDINKFFEETEHMQPKEVIQYVVKSFSLIDLYGSKSEEADNMRDFYFTAKNFENKNAYPRDALIEFTANSTLSDGELEKMLLAKGNIPIITIHQAKGLEFDYLFLAGLQDTIFPNKYSLKEDLFDEEKRVFYVALTRVKKKLYMTYSKYSSNKIQNQSRLISYIDKKYISYI